MFVKIFILLQADKKWLWHFRSDNTSANHSQWLENKEIALKFLHIMNRVEEYFPLCKSQTSKVVFAYQLNVSLLEEKKKRKKGKKLYWTQ